MFNCSDDRVDFSSLWLVDANCESADYNETSFIVGTCLPSNVTFSLPKHQTHARLPKIDDNNNIGSIKLKKIICAQSVK